MNTLDIGSLIIAGVVAIWGIYQTRVTARLEKEVQRLNIQLNQRLQLLHRARDAAIRQQENLVFVVSYRENSSSDEKDTSLLASRISASSAAGAELRGLALAIEDKELLQLVSRGIHLSKDDYPLVAIDAVYELEARGKYQKIHKRIGELIKQETTI